ncbi:dihydrofolate reductase family protein [Kribbella sp. VKM Ac-2566]|uniref:dihydrofolate reductase family protein n=1 Tax=Kribbella sp. VKM Ac-2566 TaxID=2512218 RepID=UPI0010627153|nr:dihydrofolate reductase family protein [Kribbella sp. VKM Ac-2566]TDX03281.1 dihydrofolate reductase [Kribbella sp. VKM Ac-2566]
MAPLVYSAIASLDGYIADADGSFDWAAPDEEVHAYVNNLERPIGTYLYGGRMYATMSYWETADDPAPVSREYAEIWRAADKIVYSRSLPAVTTARTRLEREFTPDGVAQLKQSSPTAISIGGANLGGQALLAGLVDEIHLFLVPVVVGGGTRALPDGLTARLELAAERRFASGFVHLHYQVTN